MTVPLRFADPMQEARRRAEEFQRLSPDERWRQIAGMMAFGRDMVLSSPRREAMERMMEEEELHWQRIQKELFAIHAG